MACGSRGLVSRSLLFGQLIACLLWLLPVARAETLRIQNPGTGSIPITGQWRFHLGDDPAWSGPAFDDSKWEQISADQTWGAQQHPGYTGFA